MRVFCSSVQDGNASDVIFLPHKHICSVKSLTIDGEDIDLSECEICDGYIHLKSRLFTAGKDNVDIIYTTKEGGQ